MTNYEKLVKALRILQDKNSLSYYKRQVCKDAADAIEKLVTLYEKTEMDATNLTGKLAQAEADVERLNLEIDKRIATEIELSNQVDALQAENPIVESVLVDKMRQQMEETACHCNVKENAELIARILDDDVDGKVYQMPKRGEWEPVPDPEGRPYKYVCSNCHRFHVNEDEWYGYCPNCGAVMGVPIMDGPIITPCRGCSDYDGYGGCKSKGGCARAKMEVQDDKE